MPIQNEVMGAATASGDGERAPIASFWVRIMTSCVNIERGVYRPNNYWPYNILGSKAVDTIGNY